MREILFRGKRVDGGGWVFGDLMQHRCGAVSINEEPERYGYGATEGFPTKVDPKTVGQFTGLLDKNAKRIFEGDVIRCTDGRLLVGFSLSSASFGLRKKGWMFTHYFGEGVGVNEGVVECEVIGSIHDSPELTEDGK